MKKIRILAAILSAALLAGCQSGAKIPAETPAPDPNIPDNVVTDYPAAAPEETTIPESLPSEDSTATEPVLETAPAATDEPQAPETEPAVEEVPLPEKVEGEALAPEYLKLLNSDRVHAGFVQVTSYGDNNVFSTDREFFIDGDDKVYINDNLTTVVHGGQTVYIDSDAMAYCVVDGVEDYGLNFGYDAGLYTLISASDEDGKHTEIFTVEGTDITSTWDFYDDGKVRVADRNLSSQAFDLYDFYVIEGSVEGMDLGIPSGYAEVTPEELGIGYQ